MNIHNRYFNSKGERVCWRIRYEMYTGRFKHASKTQLEYRWTPEDVQEFLNDLQRCGYLIRAEVYRQTFTSEETMEEKRVMLLEYNKHGEMITCEKTE